jgi:hypothetical protein
MLLALTSDNGCAPLLLQLSGDTLPSDSTSPQLTFGLRLPPKALASIVF